MDSFGGQIKNARKAKGMSQDDLANALHITRAAVANYEQDRRKPDANMVALLSEVLDTELKTEEEAQADAGQDFVSEQEAIDPATEKEGSAPEEVKSKSGKKKALIFAAVAAAAVMIIVLMIIRPWEKAPMTYSYTSPVDGVTYTVERLQEKPGNEAGKAYLRVDTVVTVLQNSNSDFWMFDFVFKEMNGISLRVDRVESAYFYKDGSRAEFNQTAEDLEGFGMNVNIPANGEWKFSGGQPVQDAALGVGVVLRATDENGAPLLVTGYIPLTT